MFASGGEGGKTPVLTLAGSAVIVVLVTVASGLGASFFIGRDLLQIRDLASQTRSEVIPFAVAEAERAIDAERLGRYVEMVVLSRDADRRRWALNSANALARRLAEQLSDEERLNLHSAMASMRAAARRADRVDEFTAEIHAELLKSETLIDEAKEIVEMIAAESSADLEEAIDDLIEFSVEAANQAGAEPVSGEAIGRLEERTASLPTINETSNRLLTTLGLMRATLLGLPSANDDAEVKELAASYETLSNRLQVMLVLLRNHAQSERLMALVREFQGLQELFPLQALVLTQRRLGRERGEQATETFASLTKQLSTESSRIATGAIEEIEAHTDKIMLTALIAAGVLAALALALALIGRREVVVPLVDATRALDALRRGREPVPLPPARLYELDALAQSLESFREATLEIKRLAAEQAEKSELLESVLANIDQGILALDRDLDIVCANARFREIFEIPPDLCDHGRPCTEIVRFQAERGEFGSDGRESHPMARLASGTASYPCSFELARPGGAVIDGRGNAMPGGGSVTAFTDITERKRAEQTLQDHASKLSEYAKDLERSNAELEQFAYVASHDLQEPLRMVSSYCQLLQRRYKDKLDKDAEEFIAYAVEGAGRMQRLINDLLAYSRVGTQGKPFAPTDCNEILAGALANLRAVAGDTAAQITHDRLPTIAGDGVQLGQLLQNLVGNAIKFRGDDPPRIHISAKPNGGDWIFSVRDNGIGIDRQYNDRIFVIFQRLHERAQYPGTGIGLAICKKIVERHGGKIWVEGAPGQGSTFYFTFPEATRPQ